MKPFMWTCRHVFGYSFCVSVGLGLSLTKPSRNQDANSGNVKHKLKLLLCTHEVTLDRISIRVCQFQVGITIFFCLLSLSLTKPLTDYDYLIEDAYEAFGKPTIEESFRKIQTNVEPKPLKFFRGKLLISTDTNNQVSCFIKYFID